MDRSPPALTGFNGSAYATPSLTSQYVTRSRAGMATSAYQQSVSPHRRSATGSDQLSKCTLAGEPRHRKSTVQPSSDGTAAGPFAAAQNAPVPGSPGIPYAAKVLSMRPSIETVRLASPKLPVLRFACPATGA